MLGFFRKRNQDVTPKPSLSKKELAIIEVCSGVLTVQKSLITVKKGKYDDDFSIGYVWGFVDAMLQNNEIDADAKGLAILSAVFLNVFGQASMPGLVGRAFRLQEVDDPNILQGMMKGGQECLEWGRTKCPVMGWTIYANGQ